MKKKKTYPSPKIYPGNCTICGDPFMATKPNQLTCGKPACKAEQWRISNAKIDHTKTDKSRCWSCGRAYARSFEDGGCPKILDGTKVYDKTRTIQLNGGPVEVVSKCQHWIPEGKRALAQVMEG